MSVESVVCLCFAACLCFFGFYLELQKSLVEIGLSRGMRNAVEHGVEPPKDSRDQS
jgi:hypothetical protein